MTGGYRPKNFEEVSSYVSLEASCDFKIRQTLLFPLLCVLLRPRIATHADESDDPKSSICIAIPSAVQAMPTLTTGRRVDR